MAGQKARPAVHVGSNLQAEQEARPKVKAVGLGAGRGILDTWWVVMYWPHPFMHHLFSSLTPRAVVPCPSRKVLAEKLATTTRMLHTPFNTVFFKAAAIC